jgi:hypothetical protein
MERYFFMRPWLAMLAGAGFLHRLVALTLRVAAALVILFSLVAFFKVGKVIFELPPSGILGGIFFQVCFILAIYAVVHAAIIRARDIDNLGKEVQTIFPMATLLLKLCGEALSAFVALVALGGGVYVWFTAKSVATVMNPMPVFFPAFGDTTFMGGIEFMVGGVLIAIISLVVFYTLSEIMGLLARLAKP